MPVGRQQRLHGHGLDRELEFLQDRQAHSAVGFFVDAIPAEKILHRLNVSRHVGVHQVVGQILTGSLIPPGPSGDQDEPEG